MRRLSSNVCEMRLSLAAKNIARLVHSDHAPTSQATTNEIVSAVSHWCRSVDLVSTAYGTGTGPAWPQAHKPVFFLLSRRSYISEWNCPHGDERLEICLCRLLEEKHAVYKDDSPYLRRNSGAMFVYTRSILDNEDATFRSGNLLLNFGIRRASAFATDRFNRFAETARSTSGSRYAIVSYQDRMLGCSRKLKLLIYNFSFIYLFSHPELHLLLHIRYMLHIQKRIYVP